MTALLRPRSDHRQAHFVAANFRGAARGGVAAGGGRSAARGSRSAHAGSGLPRRLSPQRSAARERPHPGDLPHRDGGLGLEPPRRARVGASTTRPRVGDHHGGLLPHDHAAARERGREPAHRRDARTPGGLQRTAAGDVGASGRAPARVLSDGRRLPDRACGAARRDARGAAHTPCRDRGRGTRPRGAVVAVLCGRCDREPAGTDGERLAAPAAGPRLRPRGLGAFLPALLSGNGRSGGPAAVARRRDVRNPFGGAGCRGDRGQPCHGTTQSRSHRAGRAAPLPRLPCDARVAAHGPCARPCSTDARAPLG